MTSEQLLFILVLGLLFIVWECNSGNEHLRRELRTTNSREYTRRYYEAKRKPKELTPIPNTTIISVLKDYRKNLVESPSVTKGSCGIIWAVSSINGSSTDYALLNKVGKGEGKFRLLAVLYEAISSAARTRYVLEQEPQNHLPPYCPSSDGLLRKIELTLFVDRDIVDNLSSEYDLLGDLRCAFDRVIYFSDLPHFEFVESMIPIVPYKRLHILVRLAPRPNLMKLLAFLSSPYEYTLYLDGDTEPCRGFQIEVFHRLSQHELLTSPNPFGYVSTNGKTNYPGNPTHPDFAAFPEVNGGVFGFRWTNRTEQLIIRALELFPYFATELGFDQDQAMMRHALFESKYYSGVSISTGKMAEFCRHGWNCNQNKCSLGCLIVHQRICLQSPFNSTNMESCEGKMTTAFARAKSFHEKNFNLNAKNRRTGREKVLNAAVPLSG